MHRPSMSEPVDSGVAAERCRPPGPKVSEAAGGCLLRLRDDRPAGPGTTSRCWQVMDVCLTGRCGMGTATGKALASV